MQLTDILEQINKLDIGEAKKSRIRSFAKRAYAKGTRNFDFADLARQSRKSLQDMIRELT
jgi:hypothetical protein